MTFVATANAVVTSGAAPVFCEVDRATRNVTAATIEAALTPRTTAVIVVHYAGQSCAMDDILALCARHRLALIEDCAQALGAAWRGRPVGAFGLGAFSFFPTKNITTGEGGMLTCQTAEQGRTARALAAHGIISSTLDRTRATRPWYRAAELAGHNYRLAHPLAAIGYHQLQRLDELNDRRVRLARRYDQALAVVVRVPQHDPGATHVYQMYTVEAPAERRDQLVQQLRERGVEASVHFDPPVHRHPYYQQRYARGPLPVTEQLARELITLPLYPDMTDEEQDWVIANVLELCGAPVRS